MTSPFIRRSLASASRGHHLAPIVATRSFTAISPLSSPYRRKPYRGRTLERGKYEASKVQTTLIKPAERFVEVYNISDIPFEQFIGIAAAGKDEFNLMKPEEYYEVLKRYAALLTKGIKPREQKKSGEFSAEELHDIGCLLRLLPSTTLSSQSLMLEAWAHAAELGSLPSLLSLSLFLARTKHWGRLVWIKKCEIQFKKLVDQGNDPDALMVEAVLLSSKGDHRSAAKLLEKARSMDPEKYTWRRRGEMQLARAYIELQRYEDARAVLLPLAAAGYENAQLELGKIVKHTDGNVAEARDLFFQSMRGGNMSGAGFLAEMANEDAAVANDQNTKEEHLRWAIEWSRLADPSVQG